MWTIMPLPVWDRKNCTWTILAKLVHYVPALKTEIATPVGVSKAVLLETAAETTKSVGHVEGILCPMQETKKKAFSE